MGPQVKEETLLAKEQELLVARADVELSRQQQGSRSEGARHLIEAKEQEVRQLQAELERREAECSGLRQQLHSSGGQQSPGTHGLAPGEVLATPNAIEVGGKCVVLGSSHLDSTFGFHTWIP